jgi:hypothetical protein
MAGKKMMISGLVLGALLLTGILTAGTIKAEDTARYPPIVQRLIERFNLNGDEVKTVFDEFQAERKQERQARFEEKLNQAVEEGTITQEQKEAIQKKDEEMAQEREQHRQEMKVWAEENGLDQFFFGEGRGWRKGF